MHEDILIETAYVLREATRRVEAMIAASQKGELFEGLDGKVYLPETEGVLVNG